MHKTHPKCQRTIKFTNSVCDQTKWEISKYEIRLFNVKISQNLAQLRRKI